MTSQPTVVLASVARNLPVRLVQLYAGLALFGVSMALMVRARLGVMPWDVLHQGLSRQLGWSIGTITVLVAAVVMLAWIPIRQRPGLGTLSNIVVIGVTVDAALYVLDPPSAIGIRIAMMLGGLVLNAIATAAYIGAGFGPGPRDGLMTGLVARTGWSVRVVKTSIEVCAVVIGWLLGGTVGVGTVLFALSAGLLTQIFLPWFGTARTSRRITDRESVPAERPALSGATG